MLGEGSLSPPGLSCTEEIHGGLTHYRDIVTFVLTAVVFAGGFPTVIVETSCTEWPSQIGFGSPCLPSTWKREPWFLENSESSFPTPLPHQAAPAAIHVSLPGLDALFLNLTTNTGDRYYLRFIEEEGTFWKSLINVLQNQWQSCSLHLNLHA